MTQRRARVALQEGCTMHAVSHLTGIQKVTEEEVLTYLVSRSDVPSSFGQQLANVQRLTMPEHLKRQRQSEKLTRQEEEHRLWNTIPCKTIEHAMRADDDVGIEMRIFGRARVLNCIGGLVRRRTIDFAPCPDVARFARSVRATEGAIVIGVLRAHEPWDGPRTGSEMALAKLYEWMRGWNPAIPLPVLGKEVSVVQAFRARKAPAARKRAQAMIADARVVMTEWVKVWNRRASVYAVKDES